VWFFPPPVFVVQVPRTVSYFSGLWYFDVRFPRASLSVSNFQNLHVKKGSVSHAHEIHFLCAPVLCDPLDRPPSEKVKTLI
jgi:hypothetical protein